MGKGDASKGDRKPRGSSSAQAAQFLARGGSSAAGFGGFSGGPSTAYAAGFAFGGVSSTRQATPGGSSASTAVSSAAAGGTPSDAAVSSQIDGEIAQSLRHLSKKEPVTKLKALQALQGLISTKPRSELLLALPPWIFLYQRLSQDPHRGVRAEASATLGALVAAVGKGVAPHLKALLGPWWLAQFDPYPDAAAAARDGLKACFPGRKQHDALLYGCTELLAFLVDQATATAQTLGDPRRDTPEEMEDRHERVASGALRALAALLRQLSRGPHEEEPPAAQPGMPRTSSAAALAETASKQQDAAWATAARLLARPGFAKGALVSKHTLVRRAAYEWVQGLVAALAPLQSTRPEPASRGDGMDGAANALASADVAASVLGALADKDPGNHSALWGMLLTYIKAFPDCWAAINMRKMFLPRLAAFLRHGCYGSGVSSWPALLPLVGLMPPATTSGSYDVPAQVLEATWQGLQDASCGRAGREAGASAYAEVCQWCLVVAAGRAPPMLPQDGPPAAAPQGAQAPEEARAAEYRRGLLAATLVPQALHAALGLVGSPAAAEAGTAAITKLISGLAAAAGGARGKAGAQEALLMAREALQEGVSAAVRAALTDPQAATEGPLGRCDALLAALAKADKDTAVGAARVVMEVLVACLHDGAAAQLPPAASTLLATLIRQYGSMNGSREAALTSAPSVSGESEAPARFNGDGGTAGAAAAGPGPSLGLPSLVAAFVAAPAGSGPAEAHAQLLLSWLLNSRQPEADWATTVAELAGFDPMAAQQGDKASDVLQTPGIADRLRRIHTLCTCIAAHHGGCAPAAAPWQAVLGALARALASASALDLAAAAVVLPVLPDGSNDTPAAVSSLCAEPSLVLLKLLLGEQGGAVASLVAPSDATATIEALAASLLGPHALAARTSPTWAALQALDGAGCAALVVLCGLLVVQQAWAAAASALAMALEATALLAWAGDVAHTPGLTYTSLEESEGSDTDAETDEDTRGGALGDDVDHATAVSGLVQQLQDQPWLAVGVGLAASAWAHGAALQQAAGAIVPGQAAEHALCVALASLANSLPVWALEPAGSQGDATRRPGQPATTAGVLAAAAHCQEVAAALAGHDAALVAFLPALLAAAMSAIESAWAALPAARKRQGLKALPGNSHATVPSQVAELQLLLAHLVLAVGADSLVAACSTTKQGSTVLAALLCHLLCTDAQAVGQPGGQAATALTAARRLLRASLLNTTAVTAAAQLLFAGACSRLAQADLGLHYSPSVCTAAVLAWLDLLHVNGPSGAPHVERFCADHILPAAASLPPSPDAPPTRVLKAVLSAMAGLLRVSSSFSDTSPLVAASTALLSASLAAPPVVLEPSEAGVARLSLAVASFPSAPHGSDSGTLHVTSEETELLVKLLKHQAARQGALAAARRAGEAAGAGPGPQQEAASEAVGQLGLAAVRFCAGRLGAAEWHAVHAATLTALEDGTQRARSLAATLSSELVSAASTVLGDSGGDASSPAAAPGVLAIQLFRSLGSKGLLAQHPVHSSLASRMEVALRGASTPANLLPAVQTVGALLHYLQHSGTARTDQLPAGLLVLLQEQRPACVDVCGAALKLLLAVGAVTCLCGVAGTSTAMAAWVNAHAPLWAAVGHAAATTLDLSIKPGGAGLGSAVVAALAVTDEWLSDVGAGLTSTDVLLSLALSPAAAADGSVASAPAVDARGAMAGAAYLTLLSAPPSVSARLCVSLGEDAQDELPGFELGSDAVAHLTAAGLHPGLAAVIGAPPDAQPQPLATQLAAWGVLLAHLTAADADDGGGGPNRAVRQALGDVPHLVPNLMAQLLPYLPLASATGAGGRSAAARRAGASPTPSTVGLDVRGALRAAGLPGADGTGEGGVAQRVFAGVLHALPATARTWFGDLRDRGTSLAVEAYTAATISPALLDLELRDVQARTASLGRGDFSVRVNAGAREVVAQLVVEEGASLEVAIRLPVALPLHPAEVECRRRVGVNDTRMRKWLLSISAFLRTNNRGVADAISMWRDSVEGEFAGIEPCLICYSVIAATNAALPKLKCHTCQVRFHPGCLYKWFKSSGKSACPHCQNPW